MTYGGSTVIMSLYLQNAFNVGVVITQTLFSKQVQSINRILIYVSLNKLAFIKF